MPGIPKKLVEYNMLLNIKAGGRNHIFRSGTQKQVEQLLSKAYYADLLELVDGRQVVKETIIGGGQVEKKITPSVRIYC